MLRRTKIVATLGPASESTEILDQLIKAGVDVVRLNFSHGSAEEHLARARRVRERAALANRVVAVLVDLQGPKLRIARFAEGSIQLSSGDAFILDAAHDKENGNPERVGLDYESLINDVDIGDILVLDDGRLEVEVVKLEGKEIHTQVHIGGKLSSNKGLNKRGGGLGAPALTDKDRRDIQTAAQMDADFVAVSFVRSEEDLHEARRLLQAEKCDAALVAKIERAELIDDTEALDRVIRAAEVIMVARGDLAVEIGDAELVGVQKYLIARARTLNRAVITATQMMESMIDNPMPTRAEVSDISNAVFDYTDAIMLSAESAVGKYPVEAVAAMARISLGAEKHPSTHHSKHRIHQGVERVDESIALAAMYSANHLTGVKAIICLTETGATPLLMSRIKSPLPIFALCRHRRVQGKVCLYKGVNSLPFDASELPPEVINQKAVEELQNRRVVEEGDLVLLTKGDYVNAQGGTNTLKIVRVGGVIR